MIQFGEEISESTNGENSEDSPKSHRETNNRIYVKNIPYPDYDSTKISNLFSRCGKIEKIFLNTKNVTNLTYAFIRYTSTSQALSAIKQFDGFDVGKKTLKVEFAYDRKETVVKNNELYEKDNDNRINYLSCEVCGKSCTTRCGRCKKNAYCSVKCQKFHYALHKSNCCVLPPTSMNTLPHTDGESVGVLINSNNNKMDKPYCYNDNENSDRTPITLHVKLAPSLLQVNEQYTFSIVKVSKKMYFYAMPLVPEYASNLKLIEQKLSQISRATAQISITGEKMYCVFQNNLPYRALALCQFSKFFRFRLIDYGVTILVSSRDAVVLEDRELCGIPPLCICGVFNDICTSRAYLLEGGEKCVSLKLISILENVHVFESAKISPPANWPSLIVGANYDVNVMHIDDLDHIFVRSTDWISKNLYNTFIRVYGENSSEGNVENREFLVGDIVKCRSKDDRFRRAKIVKIMANTISVFFIDSSDQLIVPKSCISHIPPIHKYFPPLVVQCMLEKGYKLKNSPLFYEYQKRRRDGLHCFIEVIGIDSNSIHFIKVLEILQPSSTSDFAPQISPVPSTTSSLKYKSIQIPPFADLTVYVSYFVSPHEFYLHAIRKDYTIALKNIHTLIENEFNDPKNIIKLTEIVVGQPVMCLNEDGGWFRSIVVEKKNETECKVMYVDFGITEIVNIEQMSSIQSKFLFDPMQAICCCLCEADKTNHSIINRLKSNQRSISVTFETCDSNGKFTVKVSEP